MALETVWQDVRFAFRGLLRNLGFSSAAILSLLLGIGTSLAIFTVADNLLLRTLPYRDPHGLVMVWEWNLRQAGMDDHNVVSPGNYLDWKRQNDVFEGMAGFRPVTSVLTVGGRSEQMEKQLVTADLLPLLGVQPIRGRLFTAEDDTPGVNSSLIISYRLWQSWFGGEERIIGRTVQVNSTPRTIVGVMPPGFHLLDRNTDLWDTLGLDGRDYRKTQGRWMLCLARLKPGIALSTAQSRMTALAKRLEIAYPIFDKNWSVNVEPLRDSMVRRVRSSLLILLGAVGLLLAVACANVANLLLARYAARHGEFAVRLSLGAGRARVFRQLLTESVLLGLIGGAAGVLAAKWTVKGLLILAPTDLTRGVQVSFDLRVLVFAVSLSVLTGILFGIAPALDASRGQLAYSLRESGRSNTGVTGRLRALLVGGEVALSVVLLAGGTLLFRSFVALQEVNPGLEPAGVLTFRVSLPAVRYPDTLRSQFFSRAIEQIEQLPGVRAASAVSYLPFSGDAAGTWVGIAGRAAPRPGEELLGIIRTVLPGYFRAMGIPLREGRDFTAADNDPKAPYRFIVNETFVNRYLTGEQPLGKRINALMDRSNPFGEIIGVVGDVKEGSVDKEPMPTVYYVYNHLSYPAMTFTVRTAGKPLALAGTVRRIIQALDPAQPIADVRTMETIVADTFSRQRFSALLLSGFSIASLLLAAVGIYGVLTYSVTERTREIGVRVALGAQPGQIIGMIVGVGARLVAVGTAVGVAGALALSGLLKSLLFGVGPRDVATFVAVPVLLGLVALLAAYLPARRAARLEPMEALRE
ncbi:MAG TPA: ABC transporter permease [Bryobacteraceae bacterium]|nr:ABC transporter permease [Bryobacteraceae bacterium]